MVYPENEINVPFVTQAVAAEVALYPAHQVVVAPLYERNPFIGLAGFTHADAHVIELNSHYIAFPPDLNGRAMVSSEATLMALEAAKESRMALAHLDVTLTGGAPGPCSDFFYQLYQNAQNPVVITRYRPEDLLGYFVFNFPMEDIRQMTNEYAYDKTRGFMFGDAKTNAGTFIGLFSKYTGVDEGTLLVKGNPVKFLRVFPEGLGRLVNDPDRQAMLTYWNGWFNREISLSDQDDMRVVKWDRRLIQLTYSIYQHPYFWNMLYHTLTT